MKNKICVYAMCKNEEQFVDKWLDSMNEADYIVVLDTGSTDNTYEMLKNDPRVYKTEQKIINPWRFDVARNESLELVPKDTDICVCTDLDEVFESGWREKLENICFKEHKIPFKEKAGEYKYTEMVEMIFDFFVQLLHLQVH